MIFPEITEVPLAATPIAPSEVDVSTAKSIWAFSPNTPTPPEAISKVPVLVTVPAVVSFRYIPTVSDLIVPPVPSKLFPESSIYTPVPVVAVIFPLFIPLLVPVPAIYIPRLALTFISFPVAFSIVAVSPATAWATIPTDVPDAPVKSIVPAFLPVPFPAYIPILLAPLIVIVPFEVRVDSPPTYEAILSEVADVIFLLFSRIISSAAYIPTLLLPIKEISELFVTVPDAIPLL